MRSGTPTSTFQARVNAGTSRSIVDTLNRIVGQGMRSPEMMKRLVADGSEPAEPNTPDQFRAYVMREYDEVEKLLKTLNLKLF